MKYMILLFGEEPGKGYEELSEDDFAEAMKEHTAFTDWCKENNVTIDNSQALEQSPTAFSVLKGGAGTDGPFLEIKEQLGGYYEIDAPTLELAKEAARRCPNYGANELRPVAVRD